MFTFNTLNSFSIIDIDRYWGVGTPSIHFGDTLLGMEDGAIVDTGTTLILIPEATFDAFLMQTGGQMDSTSGLVKFSRKPTEQFTITIGEVPFPLTPEQYLIPEAQ